MPVRPHWVHCRADARHLRIPEDVTTEKNFALINRYTEFGSPILVFTGGDAMMHGDLFDLIEYADQAGLRAARRRRPRPPMSAGSPGNAERAARSAAPDSPSTTA